MKRALVLLLACACASAIPIPTGDRPAWVSTPNGDVRFPADRFVAAVGSTQIGSKKGREVVEAADSAAKAAVASSLTTAFVREGAGVDAVTPYLQDVQIGGRWRDGNTAYAWALFDKGKAVAAEQAKYAAHAKAAQDLIAEAEAAPVADALRAYVKAHGEAAAATAQAPLVRALGGVADPVPTTVSENKAAALVSELVLNVVEGDQQRVAEGAPLPAPIVFSAWVKGKRAAGLPMAVSIDGGGRAQGVTVGPDGKGEVRVESIGKFTRAEQPIRIAVDWKAIAGEAPAWAPKAEVVATAVRKGLDTTRVLVMIAEKPAGSGATGKIAESLKAGGFVQVQTGEALLEKYGAERIAKMTDAQVCDASRRVADVVVFGTAAASAGIARAKIRAIDVPTGAVMWEAPSGEVKGSRPLEALGEALGPALTAALKSAP